MWFGYCDAGKKKEKRKRETVLKLDTGNGTPIFWGIEGACLKTSFQVICKLTNAKRKDYAGF